MTIFIVKIAIAAIGLCFALANLVKYIEKKDKKNLRRAAIFFFGMWLVLILVKVIEIWVYKK